MLDSTFLNPAGTWNFEVSAGADEKLVSSVVISIKEAEAVPEPSAAGAAAVCAGCSSVSAFFLRPPNLPRLPPTKPPRLPPILLPTPLPAAPPAASPTDGGG